MGSVTKHNTPALRLGGFSGAWVDTVLCDIVDRLDAARVPVTQKNRVPGPYPYYGANGIQDFINGWTHEGQFVLIAEDGANDLNDYPIYLVQGRIWVNNHAHVVRGFSDRVLNEFLAVALKIVDFARVLVGGSRAKLNASQMMDIELSIPSTLEEQRAIGEIFSNLDALIKQHRAKHANLQQTKTALLQRMFPQDGADEPELRLGGFRGRWKRVSFGDTVESFKYGVNAAATDYDGVTKYLRITDLDESSGQFGTGLVTSPRAEEETIRSFLLEEGDMVFARTGATVGRSYLFTKSVGRTVWAGFLIRARFKRNTDPHFVAAYAHTDSYWTYVKLTSQRSGQPGLNSAEYAAMPITTPPTLEEQRAIGEVFSNLDALITAEASYITQLTQAKTALLQRMFV